MIAIMWQFEVKQGRESEFEELYGVDGDWTSMNRHARSYLGTSFLRDQNRSSRYLIIEYWSEMLVYDQHRAFRSDAIASLEQRSQELVDSVEPMGVFSALNVPDHNHADEAEQQLHPPLRGGLRTARESPRRPSGDPTRRS